MHGKVSSRRLLSLFPILFPVYCRKKEGMGSEASSCSGHINYFLSEERERPGRRGLAIPTIKAGKVFRRYPILFNINLQEVTAGYFHGWRFEQRLISTMPTFYGLRQPQHSCDIEQAKENKTVGIHASCPEEAFNSLLECIEKPYFLLPYIVSIETLVVYIYIYIFKVCLIYACHGR